MTQIKTGLIAVGLEEGQGQMERSLEVNKEAMYAEVAAASRDRKEPEEPEESKTGSLSE